MKTLKIFSLGMLLLLAGCKKNWLDVNYNPRELTGTNATPQLILPALLERCLPGSDDLVFELWMGYWSHWNIPSSSPIVNYNRVQVNGRRLAEPQATPAAEIFFLERKAREAGQGYYVGIAKVLRALKWAQAVDVIDNLPYSEAYNEKILQPAYDNGKKIYADLMIQLDSAFSMIKDAGDAQSIGINFADIMFAGDKAQWFRFINTLKLRLLIHQGNRPEQEAYILDEMAKISLNGEGFLLSGEDASVNPGYKEVFPNQLNPYFGLYSSHNYTYGGGFYDAETQVTSTQLAHAGWYAMELLKADEDPRLGLFYSTVDIPFPAGEPEPYGQSEPSAYRGNKFGFLNNPTDFPYQDGSYVSAVGGSRNVDLVNSGSKGVIKGRNMDAWIMTSIESKFLQAEAIYRGWMEGDPEQAYLDAVKESFRWLNAGGNSGDPSLSDAIFEDWYAGQQSAGNMRVSWTAAPDKFKLIMFQKYMAFNGIAPLESWTDYRRNGRLPDVPASLAPTVVKNEVPIRILYHQDEYLTNAANVQAQGNIDMFRSKIWWMP